MLHGVVDLASKKAETGALDAAKVGISAVQLLFLAPVPVLPAFMLVRNVLGAVWGSTPGRLIPMITGICQQSKPIRLFMLTVTAPTVYRPLGAEDLANLGLHSHRGLLPLPNKNVLPSTED